MHNLMLNNKLQLAGKIIEEPYFSYEMFEEKFYEFKLEVPRLSDRADILPVVISEKLMKHVKLGNCVLINGQIRTYNKIEEGKRRLLIFTFVHDVKPLTAEELNGFENPNSIELHGFVCKQPIFRETPLGRDITDLLIAVNRTHNKSDYIPTIAWGRNAKYSSEFNVGDNVKIMGRFQSRGYVKKADGNETAMTAYEVSINKIDLNNCDIALEA